MKPRPPRPPRLPSSDGWDRWHHWPLLAGALALAVVGASLLATADRAARDAAGVALIVLGAVLLGAWTYALGRAGHDGADVDDPDP